MGSGTDVAKAKKGRPTLKDVAREAAVHYSTASLALAGDERIAPETAERIRRVAERLHYTPNRAARALRRFRTGTLAFVFWGTTFRMLPIHFHEYMLAAAQSALESGYHLLVICVSDDQIQTDPIDAIIEQTAVDGALFVGDPFDRPGLTRLVRTGFPAVHLGRRDLDDVTLAYVGADYRHGGRIATEHLLQLGHRRIAALHLVQPHAPEIHRERVGGYLEAMAEAGCEPRVRRCACRFEGETSALLDWLRDEQVTAVFCADYFLATTLLDLCRDRGVAIPDDLSLVAFDDLASAPSLVPPLTTVRQPRDEAGRRAVDLALGILDGKVPNDPVARQILLPTELIVRASTAPPRCTIPGER